MQKGGSAGSRGRQANAKISPTLMAQITSSTANASSKRLLMRSLRTNSSGFAFGMCCFMAPCCTHIVFPAFTACLDPCGLVNQTRRGFLLITVNNKTCYEKPLRENGGYRVAPEALLALMIPVPGRVTMRWLASGRGSATNSWP